MLLRLQYITERKAAKISTFCLEKLNATSCGWDASSSAGSFGRVGVWAGTGKVTRGAGLLPLSSSAQPCFPTFSGLGKPEGSEGHLGAPTV